MMLSIQGVHTFYGQIEALKGVDIEVKEGEIVTLIGANGAGKSTLLMTICGNPRAASGRIYFDGQDITDLPLQERRNQRGGTLSGGEQQMLAIGRALMSRPKLLLLDEPSLGLAPMIVKQLFAVIKEINEQQGVTIFLVEQNAYHALRLAHRGYVMATGEVIMAGAGAELLANPRIHAAYLEGGHQGA